MEPVVSSFFCDAQPANARARSVIAVPRKIRLEGNDCPREFIANAPKHLFEHRTQIPNIGATFTPAIIC
jgi:hypothetical protein